ncbi:MAG: hypothetical protein V8Q79_06780 [Christensenellales bacterium]
MDAIKVKDLYDLTHTRAAQMLETCEYPWEALDKIGAAVLAVGETLDAAAYDHPAENVWIAEIGVCRCDGEHHGSVRHRRKDGSTPRRIHPRQCAGGGRRSGRKLLRAEELHSV